MCTRHCHERVVDLASLSHLQNNRICLESTVVLFCASYNFIQKFQFQSAVTIRS
jgi:hypothetical protein